MGIGTTKFALLLSNDGSPLMGERAVAELLGISVRTLANQRSAGSCPIPMARIGAAWSAHVDDVAAYIDAQFAAARASSGCGAVLRNCYDEAIPAMHSLQSSMGAIQSIHGLLAGSSLSAQLS